MGLPLGPLQPIPNGCPRSRVLALRGPLGRLAFWRRGACPRACPGAAPGAARTAQYGRAPWLPSPRWHRQPRRQKHGCATPLRPALAPPQRLARPRQSGRILGAQTESHQGPSLAFMLTQAWNRVVPRGHGPSPRGQPLLMLFTSHQTMEHNRANIY